MRRERKSRTPRSTTSTNRSHLAWISPPAERFCTIASSNGWAKAGWGSTAVDTTLDREVAIKILPAAFGADPERLSRFEREAKVLASRNHPNVAAVYGLHLDGGVRFLAMELVCGRSLGAEIARGPNPGRVIELATAIADGLAAAHRQQVTNRDLKPDNMMIDADGRPKILDFGLAKLGAIVSPDIS